MSTSGTRPAAFAGTLGITEEHLALHAAARRWVDAHVDPVATKAALDVAVGAEARPAFWADLVELGWLGLHIDEAHGGEGYGPAELAVVLEELGRACAPGPFLPTVVVSSIVQALGSAAQRAAWLPRLVTGTTAGIVLPVEGVLLDPARGGALAGARPGAGAGALQVTGEVAPVFGGADADLVVVPVVVPGEAAAVWCVLERDDPDVELRALPSTDATRRAALLRCDDVAIGPDRQLVAPGGLGDPRVVVAGLAAVLVAAESVGGAAWCVETAAAYAAQRVQFGRPIGQFQAVKHRCAGMLLTLEQARAAAWDAAQLPAFRGDPAPTERADAADEVLGGTDPDPAWALTAAVAAAIAPDAYFAVAKDALQVLGGIGYTWDHDAHHHIKRATASRLLLGGPGAWRARVADLAIAGHRRTRHVELPPEAEPWRDEVRRFVADTKQHESSTWTARMADAGYLVPFWPPPWGRGAAPLEQLVIDEELAAAGLRRPHLQVGGWVLPTLIAHGTPEQQERWIRPTLHGRILWCQLFSEPDAGSDLASLTTRAVRDPAGGWRVTGQKVWTTMAHLANWGILLARTDPTAPKHEGITCFIVDMATPGIDIRPLRELTGAELFNEVFFDDVLVPDDAVVGGVGGGWEAARTTLGNERVSMGSGSSFGPGVESVLRLHTTAPTDPVLTSEVGELLATAQAVAAMGQRSTLRALAGATPGAEASVRKLLATEHEQRVQEVGLELLGAAATTTDGEAALWVNGFLGNRALSIAGGTSDIQRNVVAERLLGLPKDPEPGS